MSGFFTAQKTSSNQVAVLDEYEFVDHKNRQLHVQHLENDAVWGGNLKHQWFLPCLETMNLKPCLHRSKGHGMIGQAEQMSQIVAKEHEDVLHAQWNGPEGRDPLEFLLNEPDFREQASALMALAEEVKEVIAWEPTLQRVGLPARIYGDLHGQFRDMLLLLQDFGFPDEGGPSFVFNGDWVDRGQHQLAVVTLVFAFKAAYPSNVFLVRGNHEFPEQNKHGGERGFYAACTKRFGTDLGEQVFNSFHETFEYIPLGALVGDTILVVHGGIGNGDWDLSYLESVQRPLNNDQCAADNVVYNVLWSDPLPEVSEESFGAHSSPRDGHSNLVHDFGKDITQKFCSRNGISMIVRSHQEKAGGHGYEVMHGAQLVRVFSARDYESMGNDGCILKVKRSTRALGQIVMKPQVIKSVKHLKERPAP
eukprot:gnl/MRDRNA2_/MRDRNA2_65231_c0_seq1.p1 gnl/MRDRNA2_/MRDRNA2_65231_c0~~gnl/MRDRNA2_/MRDRNA2_65231_c0_seq1.p1  ORF type:complete len:421 (-),score=79.92 gnl/MRDRNA2_/MRDRNA2_65231_c0_seq1:343-1605(-)